MGVSRRDGRATILRAVDLVEFKRMVNVLPQVEADAVRRRYIDAFVDTNHPSFERRVGTLRLFRDGLAYDAYLWDYLKNWQRVSELALLTAACQQEPVYAFWDIHSNERIWIEDYWKLGKETVLQADYATITRGLEHLPEDIYIASLDMSWTYVLTHEYDPDPQDRICVYAEASPRRERN